MTFVFLIQKIFDRRRAKSQPYNICMNLNVGLQETFPAIKQYVFKALNEVDEHGIMVITRRNKQNIIMMSEEEYEGMLETLDIMKNKPEYEHILQSMADPRTEVFDSIDKMWANIDGEIEEEKNGKL